mmetsp:Transcript_4861/g.12004  ORF Transcript_4861/g.12004 Transcript_4861/m.12004 type:complete len:109 (+) Transcript_4861:1736-2062(+)
MQALDLVSTKARGAAHELGGGVDHHRGLIVQPLLRHLRTDRSIRLSEKEKDRGMVQLLEEKRSRLKIGGKATERVVVVVCSLTLTSQFVVGVVDKVYLKGQAGSHSLQ